MKGGFAVAALCLIVGAVAYVVLLADSPAGAPAQKTPPLKLPTLPDADPDVRAALEEAFAAATAKAGQAELARYARVLHAHGMHDEAEPVYLRAAELDGDERLACLYLAAICADQNDPERAVAISERALALGDDDPLVHLRMAQSCERVERLEAAAFHFGRASDLSPSSHAYFGLGRVALVQGRADIAVKFLEKARQVDPRHHEIALELARAYRQAGDEDAARKAAASARPGTPPTLPIDPYLEAVLVEGRSFHTYLARAKRAAEKGENERALELFDAALAKRPDAMDALLPRAVILNELRRWKDCLTAVQAILKVRPGDPAALTLAGDCHWNLGDLERAERSFQAVLVVKPDHPVARYKLALTVAPFRRHEAKELLEPLVRARPQWVDARLLLGKVYNALGDKGAAAREFEAVLALRPGHREAARLLASLRAE